MTYAKVVKDSISSGVRLVSMEVRIRRFVLAELNTHRTFGRDRTDDFLIMEEFCRNSASSRAIPLQKQVERLVEEPARPVVWASEQKGMSGGDEVADTAEAEQIWSEHAQHSINAALRLGQINVHKSLANRLLEPHMWHTVLITSTSWDNFFSLRLDPLAQPEIRVAAEAMKEAYDASTPTELVSGQWHLPYIEDDDIRAAEDYLFAEGLPMSTRTVTEVLIKMSTAKCARLSYLAQDGTRDVADEVRLYDVLRDNGHASPMEHVAAPDWDNTQDVAVRSRTDPDKTMTLRLPRYGVLLAWHQHRFDVEVARAYQSHA